MLRFAEDSLLEGLPGARLRAMHEAALGLEEMARQLSSARETVISRVLGEAERFEAWSHYPDGGVHNPETHCQFFYHRHDAANAEHGHFHTFVRAGAMPKDLRPLDLEGSAEHPRDGRALAHIAAVSMDVDGRPTHLFTTNRWVTDETLFPAADVIGLLDRLSPGADGPHGLVNRWLGSLLALFRPQVEMLLHKRDAVLRHHIETHPGENVAAHRGLEITSIARIDVGAQIAALRRALEHQLPPAS
ncbi:MAG: DUF6969 family protein [Minwuia sp.]|uniref:DUF6969 family protein n=1 Tax=Minwuia sp. TaxID=2493630 RepID=UPI003A8C57FF